MNAGLLLAARRAFAAVLLALVFAALLCAVAPRPANAIRMAMTEEYVCKVTTLAVVGKVVGRASFVPGGSGFFRGTVFSIVTLQVEAVLLGPPTPAVQFLIMGGTLHDGTTMWAEDNPKADVGTRYLALLSAPPDVPMTFPPDADLGRYVEDYRGPYFLDVFELNASAELLDEIDMRALWAKHCSGPKPVGVGLPSSVLKHGGTELP